MNERVARYGNTRLLYLSFFTETRLTYLLTTLIHLCFSPPFFFARPRFYRGGEFDSLSRSNKIPRRMETTSLSLSLKNFIRFNDIRGIQRSLLTALDMEIGFCAHI